MSNKIAKKQPKEKQMSSKEDRIKKGQQFFGTTKLTNKVFSLYVNRSKLDNVKRRSMIHQIISAVLIEIVAISFGYVYKLLAITIATMLYCIINSLFCLWHIKNDENKKQQIFFIATQIIIFVIGIIAVIIPGPA